MGVVLSQDEIRRNLENFNLTKLAKEIGISYRTLNRISNGESNVNMETLTKISKYFVKFKGDIDVESVTKIVPK